MANNSVVPQDPFGPIKQPASTGSYPSAQEVNRFHTAADTDSGALAAHHTLGVKHDQASPGDHLHDGVGSKLIMENIVVTGSKGGNAALADLITKLSNALGFIDGTT
jgi:hypothetical protein